MNNSDRSKKLSSSVIPLTVSESAVSTPSWSPLRPKKLPLRNSTLHRLLDGLLDTDIFFSILILPQQRLLYNTRYDPLFHFIRCSYTTSAHSVLFHNPTYIMFVPTFPSYFVYLINDTASLVCISYTLFKSCDRYLNFIPARSSCLRYDLVDFSVVAKS